MDSKFILLILKMVSKEISGNELKVFCILMKHMDSNNECYPSMRTISKKYGMSTTTVSKCISSLEEKHVIIKQTRTIDGKNISNLYKINSDFLVPPKKKKKFKEILPDWFYKEIESKKPSEDKLHELEKMMEEFK